jgi:hypothetical protein
VARDGAMASRTPTRAGPALGPTRCGPTPARSAAGQSRAPSGSARSPGTPGRSTTARSPEITSVHPCRHGGQDVEPLGGVVGEVARPKPPQSVAQAVPRIVEDVRQDNDQHRGGGQGSQIHDAVAITEGDRQATACRRGARSRSSRSRGQGSARNHATHRGFGRSRQPISASTATAASTKHNSSIRTARHAGSNSSPGRADACARPYSPRPLPARTARPERPAPSSGAGAGRTPAKLTEVAASQVAAAKVEMESQFFMPNVLQPYQTSLSVKARSRFEF